MLTVPKAPPPANVKRVSVKNWTQGTVTAFDDGRTPSDGLKSSGNVYLDQDGTVRPRPSLTKYGPQPTGTVLGEIFPFRALDGLNFTNWLICLQNVSGTVNAYIAKGSDTAWTLCSGKTYDTSAQAHFCQIQDKVLIMNGSDALSYLDIPTSAVIPFSALTTPVAPTGAVSSSLTGTGFNVYYAVTSNSKTGETDGSPVLTKAIKTARDLWNPVTPDAITITRTAVTNEESWNLYCGVAADGAGAPQLYAIATGLDKGSLTFTDDGTRGLQLLRPLPTFNSTAGPRVTRGTVINGRPWLVGDADNPYYVRNGGDPGFELDFSPSNGGGFSQIGNGTEELPTVVLPYRDGKGNFEVTVLAQGASGKGKRYLLSPDSVTYGSQTIPFYDVTEDNGRDGTDSPDGVILYNDSLWYPSRDGFKTTGTKPQLQNILSTDRISNTIQPDISTLNNDAMSMCVGLAFEGRLYWALPVGSNTNNEVWVLDLDRGGAWMKPWSFRADWMTLYTDNDGTTHFLVLSDSVLYELSYIALTADDGIPFSTNGNSGQIPFSPDGMMWGKLIQLEVVLLRPQGAITFTVAGETQHDPISTVGTQTFIAKSSRAGWSEPKAGWSSLRGWSQIVTVPRSFNDATQIQTIKINKDLRWFSYGWNTTDPGVDYNIADVIALYVEAGVKSLS